MKPRYKAAPEGHTPQMHRRIADQAHVTAVDTQTLADSYGGLQRKGVRLVPRPGYVAELDFPIVLTSETDGTVYLVEKTSARGIGDVVIELLDSDRRVVSSIKSSSDDYDIVPAVSQGRYSLRVSPKQLQQLDLIDPGMRAITISPDGEFVNGVDFLLRKNLDGTVSDLPGEGEFDQQRAVFPFTPFHG